MSPAGTVQDQGIDPSESSTGEASKARVTRDVVPVRDGVQDTGVDIAGERKGSDASGGRWFTLVGRCVSNLSTELPVAGVELGLSIHLSEVSNSEFGLSVDGDYRRGIDWQAPARVVTSRDGTFEIRLRHTKLPLRLEVESPYSPFESEGIWLDDSEELRDDLGNLLILRGYPVRGSIVDQKDRAIDRNLLRLKYDSGPEAVVKNGRFDFGYVAEGTFDIYAREGKIISVEEIKIGPRLDTTNLKLVLQTLPTIEGVVLYGDTDQPVVNYPLEAEDQELNQSRTRTDQNGRFRIQASSLSAKVLVFTNTYDEDDSLGFLDARERYQIPQRDLVLRVKSWPRFKLRATRPNGEAVNDYFLRSPRRRLRLDGPIVDGVGTFYGVPPGKAISFYAKTLTDPLESSRELEFDPGNWEDSPYAFILEPAGILHLQVKDSENNPMAATVTLRDGGEVFAKARIPDSGEGEIVAPAHLDNCLVGILGTKAVRPYVVSLTAEHTRTRRLEITRIHRVTSGKVSVKVNGIAASMRRKYLSRLLLLRQRGQSRTMQIGQLRDRELPAGEWDLLLDAGRAFGNKTPLEHLSRFTVRPRETVELSIEVQGLVPGRLQGQVLHLGKPLANSSITFEPVKTGLSLHAFSDEQGQFDVGHVPVGRYRASTTIAVADVTNERTLWFAGEVEVVAGGHAVIRLQPSAASIDLRVLMPDGSLAKNCWLDIEDYGKSKTNALGVVRIQPIPPHGIFVLAKRASVSEGPLPEGKLEGPLTPGRQHRLQLRIE